MAAHARSHLHIVQVDAETGESQRLDEHPEIQGLRDEIKGLKRDLAAWRRRYAELERDKEREARDSQLWPVAVRIFRAWQLATGHTRCNFDHKRFALVEPHLKKKGPEVCLRAVAGIAFDHFSTPRKNGSLRHFDEWERVFKDAGQVEERANSAPKDWRVREPFCVALVSLEPWLKP
jgi:hypothetical protein